jgi:hypothetical protein
MPRDRPNRKRISGASPLRGLKMLDELTDQGNAVVVFEHKHEVIKTADCG